ncbi:protein kinase [Deinococcus lacus]|uniref:Protein kinase n=1 Tax=Deinococcus lacus TaxID=392561 RepID=A0ABW1Y9Y9_9DEIO
MNLLLLAGLFTVGLMLALALSERALGTLLAALMLALCAALGILAVQAGADLARIQALACITAVLLGSALVRPPAAAPEWFRRLGGRPLAGNGAPASPPHPRRTWSPVQPSNQPTVHQHPSELQFQHYDVIDRVGIGGMGSVYLATRKSDGAEAALKVPQEKYLADEKFVKRFYREAEILARLDHPNIVKVFDYRMDGPEHYIAMEYLKGRSLEDLLEGGSLSPAQSVQILRALADGLRHIHLHKIVHRDLKPANVMVLDDAWEGGKLRPGGVKLMDFGIAVGAVLSRLTITGARVGTPTYMAPEQAKGIRTDFRSDVYSLGLLGYEMACGKAAFEGGYESVVHQQVFEEPKPPNQVNPAVPSRLNDLILSMIEKDPDKRPALDEVIQQLDEGVLTDEVFDDPVALAVSVHDPHARLRLLDLSGKLRVSWSEPQTPGEPARKAAGAPRALAQDGLGHLYLAYHGGEGGLIRRLGSNGHEEQAFGPYGLALGELLRPAGLAVYGNKIYVLDAESHFITVFDTQGQALQRFGGRGAAEGLFEHPQGLSAAPDGTLYVLDAGNRRVQRFGPDGEYLSKLAFRLAKDTDDLRPLEGLTVGPDGAAYLVDSVAGKVRRITAEGAISAPLSLEPLIGEPSDTPWLMAVGPQGFIYVVRQGGQLLRIYTAAGDLKSQRNLYAPVLALSLLTRQVSS